MSRPSDPKGSTRPTETARLTAEAFRRGEPAAVRRVRRYVRRILGFRRLGLDPSELPDLEQQVMTQVWSAATRPDFSVDAGFWGFVETVTARRCIDLLRRRRPTTELPETLEDGEPSPLETLLDGERSKLAEGVLARLAAPCRELIELHTVRCLSYREIAQILGASEGSLRVRMHRCVEVARRMLADSAQGAARAADIDEGDA